MTTPDALSTLQQAIKSRSPITYSTTSSPSDATPLLSQATHIVFSGSAVIPKTAPTRFRKPPPNHAEFYSLDALYLAWVLKDAAVAEYMKQARENSLAHGFVGITERKKVVDWLEGRGGIEDGRIQQGRTTLLCPHRLMFLNSRQRRLSG